MKISVNGNSIRKLPPAASNPEFGSCIQDTVYHIAGAEKLIGNLFNLHSLNDRGHDAMVHPNWPWYDYKMFS